MKIIKSLLTRTVLLAAACVVLLPGFPKSASAQNAQITLPCQWISQHTAYRFTYPDVEAPATGTYTVSVDFTKNTVDSTPLNTTNLNLEWNRKDAPGLHTLNTLDAYNGAMTVTSDNDIQRTWFVGECKLPTGFAAQFQQKNKK